MEDIEKRRHGGNQALLEQDFLTAVNKYTEALKLLSEYESSLTNEVPNQLSESLLKEKAKLYSNRSHAQYLQGKYKESVTDAGDCIDAQPKWDKGYVRKALALAELHKLSSADQQSVEKLEMIERIYMQGLKMCGQTDMLCDGLSKIQLLKSELLKSEGNDDLESPCAPRTTPQKRVAWDEATLKQHFLERGHLYGTMKIDHPDTPFLAGSDESLL